MTDMAVEDVESNRYRVIHDEQNLLETRNIARIIFDRACGGRRQLTSCYCSSNSNAEDNDEGMYGSLHIHHSSSSNSTSSNFDTRMNNKTILPYWRNASLSGDLRDEIRRFGEAYSVTRFRGDYLDVTNTVSTISVAFSPDGRTLASTHGDHTVKISCCHTGKLVKSLVGHPRTPWTVKFHPSDSNICASGCIGYQVRVWDIKTGECIKMVRLYNAIISLSFHPYGNLLSIACGNALYLWDYVNKDSPHAEWAFEHALRCVCFLPRGDKIIVGGLVKRQHSRDRDTFGLKLWDFNYDMAMKVGDSGTDNEFIAKSVLTNCRKFLNRALLYNDGGFDVSSCGRYLVACSEWWLPDGVNCIMDLVRSKAEEMKLQENQKKMKGLSLESPRSIKNNDADVNTYEAKDDRLTNDAVDDDDVLSNSPSSPPNNAIEQRIPRTPPPPPVRRRNNVDSLLSLPENTQSAESMVASMALSPPPPPQRRRTGTHSDYQIGPTTDTNQQGEAVMDNNGSSSSGNETNAFNNERIRLAREAAVRMALGTGTLPMLRREGASHPHGRGVSSPDSIQDFLLLGRYVPHVVYVCLDSDTASRSQLIDASPLEESRASGVTCVKFSPSSNYCLLGYGVRENEDNVGERPPHQVTSLFRVQGRMKHLVSLMSLSDDVNIARFHPDSGHGFVYGTKQGRVRVLAPKPWTSPLSPSL